MQRIGFRLQLKMELMDEYVEHHKNVWPEMRKALSDTGWTNYSIFLDRNDGTLFGYLETEDFDSAREQMLVTEINAKWQAAMAGFFEDLEGSAPDEGLAELEQIFFLA